jgi:NAD(P)-dependent dehydrogenase (short-subunit alcohol dehydrogenase family)
LAENRLDLTGKVALVTGGARGIGRAICELFAEAGADLIIASRKLEACQAVADELAARHGVRTAAIGFNASVWADCDRLAEEGWARFGRIDILVNNAGVSPAYDSIENISEALFDKIVAVNLKGPFRLAAVIGARMVRAGGGAIVNIGSSAASHPVPSAIPYSAAKAGLTNMTRGLASLFGPNVRVNCVQPAGTATDMSANFSEDFIQEFLRDYAIKRFARPEEVAAAALYLASEAASFSTGTVLRVDGGIPG